MSKPKEYAVQLDGPFGTDRKWSDNYPTLGDARRAGKDMLKNKGYGWSASLLRRTDTGAEIGAQWEKVGHLNWCS